MLKSLMHLSSTICSLFLLHIVKVDGAPSFIMQPTTAPRPRSKLDSLIYFPESVKAPNLQDDVSGGRSQFSLQEGDIEKGKEMADQQTEVDAEPENIERPVDLYKVIGLLLFKSVVKVYSSLLHESVLAKFSLIWTIMFSLYLFW